MKILGIETSCDETSAAVVSPDGILSNIISTQLVHKDYGGVVPEFASRAHIQKISAIIKAALEEAKTTFDGIDGLAVTYGPGLAGSLLVGLCLTKGMALSLNKPWIGINHIEGHILANTIGVKNVEYPYLALVASGGHTILVLVKKELSYEIVGQSIDDAAGEAFDKVAKVLGLGYPGGPIIEKIANQGDPNSISFPRALMEKGNLNFSFSGLKTAVLYHVQSQPKDKIQDELPNIAASFQHAVIDVLATKSIRALEKFKCKNFVLAGGVVRNKALRTRFESDCNQRGISFSAPAPDLCTDNAAMIAQVGLCRMQAGEQSSFELDVKPNLSLTSL